MRHKTGNYYARLYLVNKEKWVSLRTDLLEVAKSKFRTHKDVLAKFVPVAEKQGWFRQLTRLVQTQKQIGCDHGFSRSRGEGK